MKLIFENVGEDIAFALAEGAKELGFEAVCKDATGGERACKSVPGAEVAFENAKGAVESDSVRVVQAVKAGEGLRVFGDEKGPWTLEYSSTGAFLRGLGLLKRYGVPGKAFDVAETAAFGTLGTMLDCSRNAVMKPESLKRFIRMTALMGFNAIMLYTEDTYEVPGEPYFGHLRGRYTREELRDIDAYAEKLGVELIPCIQTLAHLKAILRWPVYSGLSDWDDILNLALPETYELIEKCIRTASECFKSRRINIGMDEAYLLGRGHYLEKKGYRDSSAIMLEHLEKVVGICKRYGFEPRMWSDMFFRMCNPQHDYYSEDTVVTERVTAIVPPEVTLVYWDYYGDDKKKYDRMFENHLKFRNPVAFAGGASCWYGTVPLNRFSVNSARAAMESAREHGIKEIYVTLWGDNGGTCSVFSTLPTLACYAENCWNGRTADDNLAQAVKAVTGASYESFMDLEGLMCPGNRKDLGKRELYPTRYMLYQDVLQGKFDLHVPDGSNEFFAKEAERLKAEKEAAPGGFSYLYDTFIALAKALSVKAELGKKLTKAYRASDRAELERLCKETIPEAVKLVDAFLKTLRKQWMYENKAFGFEIHDIRFGGLKERLSAAAETVASYLAGDIDAIEELEAPRLPYDPYEPLDAHGGISGSYLNEWVTLVTQNGI